MAGPLQGVTVVDFTEIIAGPLAGRLLAEMGADVIKVEKAPGGDDSRRMAPPRIGDESAAYLMVNRNKRGIIIDLKTADGKAVIRRMLESADVLI